MYVAQKIELKISNKDLISILEQSFGYSRYIYNKALNEWKHMYELYKEDSSNPKPSHRRVRDVLKNNKEPWEENQLKQVLDTACEDLGKAFNMMWKGYGRYPKYKSKKKSKNSFRFYRKNKYTIQIKQDKYLKLQSLPYTLKLKEKIKYTGDIKEVTISRRANKYFASFIINSTDEFVKVESNNSYVGIDLGIKDLAIINDSNGKFKKYHSLRDKLIPYYNKIKYYNKSLSKKVFGSNNYKKVKTKLNLTYLRIDNIMRDYLHKITTNICLKYKYVTIEDLNVSGMIKNRKLSEKIAHSNWRMFRTFLEYKAKIYGNTIIVADRWFPSTQTCSSCGNVLTNEDKLTLKDRIYICPKCHSRIDRDYNASINLKLYGMRFVGMAKEGKIPSISL